MDICDINEKVATRARRAKAGQAVGYYHNRFLYESY